MKKNRIICLLLSVFLAATVMAQNNTVRGVVLDENGETVIGGSVSIPGTKIATVTDMDGKYALNGLTSEHKTIQVSYLGYKTQTVDITGKQIVNITLEPQDTELNEVVIVGYGVQKKAHLTGSVATVAPSDIIDLAGTNLVESLSGLMQGVSVESSSNRPGEPSRINIRNGDMSIKAPSTSSGLLKPLYVIDDFAYPIEEGETAFNNLDANMIENISILKDASAAVYGARSAQGVVLVKTKRGQVGKPKISYTGQFGYTDEFYRSKMLDAYQYGVLWNATRAATPKNAASQPDATIDFFQADELEAMKSLNYDLLDKYWTSGLTQRHSINVGGGSENATYFGGVSYVTQDGNLGKIDFGRWNYRAGVDAKINKWTKATLQVSGDNGHQRKSYIKVTGENDENDYMALLQRPRYIPEYVNGLPVAAYGITNNKAGDGANIQNYNYDVVENMGNYSRKTSQNMTINSSLEYDFGWSEYLKGLKLKVSYSKNTATTKDNLFASNYTLYKFLDGMRGGSGHHLYADVAGYPADATSMTKVDVVNGDFLRRRMEFAESYQMNFVATYARSFGLHSVSGLFTIERSERESEYVWGKVNEVYGFTNHQSNGAGGTQETEFKRSESAMLSYVGRLNYAYADKYLLEFLARSDASTKFAPENYWGLFPSLSLGWIISEEPWFKEKVSAIDFLKIRGSYGLLGRDNVKAWAWAMFYGNEAVKGPIFGVDPSKPAGPHLQQPKDLPNRDSHWDNSHQTNLGLDVNFLNNRLTTTLEGYYTWAQDVFMVTSNTADYTVLIGAESSPSNFGAINKWGAEISVGWRDKIGKDFKYHIKLNTGYTDNKVVEAPWDAINTRALDALEPNQRADRGLWGYECIGMFRSYQEIAEYFASNNLTTYLGKTQADIHPGTLIYNNVRGSRKSDGSYYEAGDPADPKGNVVDADDRVRISKFSSNPYGFTINTGCEWKGVSISAQLGASWGSYRLISGPAISNEISYQSFPSFWADNMFIYKDVLDGQGNVVAAQNVDAKYPNLNFASINSEKSTFWKISNTNIALNNITMAYSLPKGWINKMGVESCRINVTGQNLLCFYNPYPDKYTSPMTSYDTYPTLRKFTVGINVSF
ncbi:MAG: TonB-dependent receptor [Dysgonamonadaceae bacterium]|nr:TonB-dependent receptor [Dysgonamonadaceae bacterium]